MQRITVLFLSALISGCVSTGVAVSPESLSKFKVGESTEADITRDLGAPTGVTQAQGYRFISYSSVNAQPRPATFIPIIGPLVGGSDVRTSMVIFKFGADGKLVDVQSHHHQSGAATGFAAGAPQPQIPDQPRRD